MDREKILSCNRCKNRNTKNAKQREFCSKMINGNDCKCWKFSFDKKTTAHIDDSEE